MGTFHYQNGSLYSPAIAVHGPGSVELDVAVYPPFLGGGRIEVQESANEMDWVAHHGPVETGGRSTLLLPEDTARKFLRLRVPSLETGQPRIRVLWTIRPRRPRSESGPEEAQQAGEGGK